MDTHNVTFLKHRAQAVGWLDLLASLMPEIVKFEVSSWVLIAAVVALWIWRRHPSRGDRPQNE